MRFALVLLLLGSLGCQEQRMTKKVRDEPCARNLDCTYGLECTDALAPADGGVAVAGKTCQYKSFGECEGDGMQSNGKPQCLSGQKCRDGHCTVQCASPKECKEGETCKIGVCQKSGTARAQCYDNRDCPWPETCFYGQCVSRAESMRCMGDLDCGPGFRCINGLCQ